MTHPRNQDGYALIEVVVSAAVLAIVALAVLTGIDGATASTARERARAVASSLAEQDQERMRSYRFDKLATIPQVPVQEIDGVKYTIESKANWVTDDAGATPVCGATNKQSEYLRVVTTVRSELVGARIAPVQIESLVAPSVAYAQDHGTLAVKVAAGVPARAAGTGVTIKHTDTSKVYTETANAAGCALFRSIETGEYTITLNRSGYVDKKPEQLSTTTATVSPNVVNVTSMPYDKSVDFDVKVRTLKPGTAWSATATRYPSRAQAVAENTAQSSVTRIFKPAGGGTFTQITAPKLFPFTDTSYSFFTGTCDFQSPAKASDDFTEYFNTVNPEGAVKGDPAAYQPQPVTIFQPALNLRVLRNATGAVTDAAAAVRVYADLQRVGADTCTEPRRELFPRTWPGGDWGTAPGNQTTNWVSQTATGTDFDPGLPFGRYKICLQDRSDQTRWWSTIYDNTAPRGQESTVSIPPSTVDRKWSTKSGAGC